MIELQLSQHRKARVWFNELPDARTASSKVSERSVQGGKSGLREVRRAAIEVLIPRGPRALYGLLGAELRPNKSEALVIRVIISNNHSMPFRNSIALRSDEAHVGLPDEFAQAVVEGAASQVATSVGLGSGELLFSHAAHGSVGSAPIVFKWLAACLVQVLREGESVGQQQIADILQSPL